MRRSVDTLRGTTEKPAFSCLRPPEWRLLTRDLGGRNMSGHDEVGCFRRKQKCSRLPADGDGVPPITAMHGLPDIPGISVG
jgi:hypothetical protein